MRDSDYTQDAIDCWNDGQTIMFTGQHRNDPTQHVERLRTDGTTLWSYGQPLVTKFDGKLLLNLTPYIITNDDQASYGPRSKPLSISKSTLAHQHQLTTYIYARPGLRAATFVFDWDGTSRPGLIQLRAAYVNALERGYELSTLDAYIEDDCYSEAMRGAKARCGARYTKAQSWSPLNAFVTLEVLPDVWRKVNVRTGEVVRTVDEIVRDVEALA